MSFFAASYLPQPVNIDATRVVIASAPTAFFHAFINYTFAFFIFLAGDPRETTGRPCKL